MTSTRIALRLALGILCGVALVLLPAVFSTGTLVQSPATPAVWAPQRAQPSGNVAGPSGSNSNGLSFATIILFIFLPSAIFSLLIRRWAERRSRDYL